MLTAADLVFLVDASGSEADIPIIDWLHGLVIGDTNNDGVKDDQSIAERLSAQGVDDLRYGLVGFGQTGRFAHSQVVGTNSALSAFERLWSDGDNAADHVDDLKNALINLDSAVGGGREDGWDAIDHAIAEYDFRPGAVPVFVLVQNAQGRVFGVNDGVNSTLTRDGILATLRSKDVILNSLVVGDSAPMFDLSPYKASENDFNNIRILGVESSTSANGQHDYHAFNTATDTPVTQLPATQSDALQISGFRREGGR